MNRPICHCCGGICIESVTAVEVRGPDRRPATFIVCSDCAENLIRRLSARSKGIRVGDREPIERN